MKNFFKRKNGITIIALIVTIVIMLILVGVVVNSAIGEDGFLKTAKELETNEELATIEGQERINELKQEREATEHDVGVIQGEDSSAPVINSITVKNKTSNSITVQVSGTETESGIKKIEYKIDKVDGEEGIWQENPTNSTATIYTFENLLSFTEYSIKVKVTDNSENSAEATINARTETEELPVSSGTKPYFPGNNWGRLGGTNLSNGLVIVDGTTGNEYVWIEVPNDGTGPDYSSVASSEDYDNIEAALKTYANIYTNANYKDVWFDKCGTIYDGVNNYSKVAYAYNNETRFNTAKEYYGTLYTDTALTQEATAYATKTDYYVDITNKFNDASGCGVTYSRYNALKNKMLKSIYENGGFFIGRYEAGVSNTRSNTRITESSEIPLSQANKAPYGYVYLREAQNLASRVNSGNCESSILFGIQWDLILKYLELKADWDTTEHEASWYLLTDSSSWGNGYSSSVLSSDGNTVLKPADSRNILKTGCTTYTMKQNTYDIAGNCGELTFQYFGISHVPVSGRGADWYYNSVAVNNTYFGTQGNDSRRSFRVTLYK